MEIPACTIVSIVYLNEKTGYSVIKVQENETGNNVIAVGIMPTVSKGIQLALRGTWESHKQYGKQFAVTDYTIIRPSTRAGIQSFLSSGIISTIGPVKANAIIDTFGLQTLDIIENTPDQLCRVPGIGKKTVARIKEKWKENRQLHDVLLFFKEIPVSPGIVHRLYKKYGAETCSTVSRNPYILCEEVYGIGFKRADTIAQGMGFVKDSYQRIRAGILFVIKESQQNGNTFVPRDKVCLSTMQLLDVPEDKVVFSLSHLCSVQLLIEDASRIYLPSLFYAETGVAKKMAARAHKIDTESASAVVKSWMQEYQNRVAMHYDELQKNAVVEIAEKQCMLLTGGPGTGKTTILKLIVAFFEAQKRKVLLAAPTGRAAQRIKEATGKTAQTIHRLLEYIPQRSGQTASFNKNEHNTLDADLIIVDEVSMIDIQLMYCLCRAIKDSSKLLLVGDSNQLPSVGAGNVIADLVNSNCFPHIHLTTVFRQAEKSKIISAAHEINNGVFPTFLHRKEDNCFFMEKSSAQEALDTLLELVTNRLPQTYKLNPVHDIQVLSPMHRGELGTENINELLQLKLKQTSAVVQKGNRKFYLGDKVLQCKNNYETNVFNGDIGYVTKIIDENSLIVEFNGCVVVYNEDTIDDLIPAYCISIHKSQGSEFNVVIIIVTMHHYMMLQRNLIYTALTRARNLCIMIGSKRALKMAVENNESLLRYSFLEERIRGDTGK